HDGEDGAADRVGVLARGIRQGVAQILPEPLDAGRGRRGDGLPVRYHERSRAVLHQPVGELILQRITQRDVADAAGTPTHLRGHARAALHAPATGPPDRHAHTDLLLPRWADLAEVLRPQVGTAAAVRAVEDRNVPVGQFHARVQALQGRVVPLPDLPQ